MKWTQIGRELYALLLALFDDETPVGSKLLVLLVFASVVIYVLSTIDFLPDIIPLLGWSDDLVAVFLGTALAEKFIPAYIMARCRARAGVRIKEARGIEIEDNRE